MRPTIAPISPTFWLYAAGFFTCTWDLLLNLDIHGFSLRAYHLFFFLAFCFAYFERREEGIFSFLAPVTRPFVATMLALAGYYLGVSPWSAFPLKSFLYSCWLIFDIFAIWLTTQHLARIYPLLYFFRTAWATMLFLSAVICIDHLAYYFGYTGGLIGGNQDIRLRWGLSRPHAFSFEPSFIASFLSIGVITTAYQMFHSSRSKWLFWSSLILIIFAMVATTSRTGWISLVMGFSLLAALSFVVWRQIPLKPIAIFFGLVGVVVVAFYMITPEKQMSVINNSLVGSIAKGQDGSGNARLNAFRMAFQLAKETKGIGTGLAASYRYYFLQGNFDQSMPGEFSEVHYGGELIMSTWGQLVAEGGILAVLLYAIAGFLLTRELFAKWRNANSGFALGACAATIVFFGFSALWIGNICRGDVWVWYALWSAVAANAEPA